MAANRYVVPLLGDRIHGRDEIGGKAFNLQRLIHANFHVPAGIVVTTAAFREIFQSLVESGSPRSGDDWLVAALRAATLPKRMREEILTAVARLKTIAGNQLVVRSSATCEDDLHASMAGQAATFVNVSSPSELLGAIAGCWASLYSRESLVYRSRAAMEAPLAEMAVIVQQLIPAERAGVLFTVDPMTDESGTCLVSSGWGLGETVVSGRAADTSRLDKKSGAILERKIARKENKLVPSASGGTHWVPVPPGLADREVVDETFAARLAGLAGRVETVFGGPQDIEWAEWQGRIYLLQTRPITARANACGSAATHAVEGPRRDTPRTVWSNSNVGEALPGVGTPFTWSFIQSFSRKGLVHAFKGFGCTVPPEYGIVGRIRGRLYLNLSQFMSVASQVPFVTPSLLQGVAGGGGADELPGTFAPLSKTRFVARFPARALQLLVRWALMPATVALWSQRFKEFTEAFAAADLESASREELLDLWKRTDRIFEETGSLLFECSGQFLLNYLTVSLALKALLGHSSMQVERELFSGLSGISSAEPGLDLLRMARRVARMPDLKSKVLATMPEDLLETLRRGGGEEHSLLSAVEAFLTSHGHRAAREAELSEPRWSEDPAFPLSVLAKYLQNDNLPDPEAACKERVARREASTGKVLEQLPSGLRRLFSRLLKQAQAEARSREDLRNAVVKTLGFFRRLALEAGGAMVRAGVLRCCDDVFFLRADEIVGWLSGEAPHSRFRTLVAVRRLEHEAMASLPDLPPFFVMEGDRIVPPSSKPCRGLALAGLPGSPGTASGTVRIARSPKEGSRIHVGDVLVTPFTDVGWTPLFLVAGAVVTELGGPLSHSCVVAREYGIPAVVNVAGACSILKEGERVLVDGDRGLVTVER
jgi:pyruvate,water dikinase